MHTIGILNGPSLARLGKREPHIYGTQTLDDLKKMLFDHAKGKNVELIFFDSNHEGALIDQIYQWADEGIRAIVINPGAYAHTSVALRDAILGSNVPAVEVHLTNLAAREPFRHVAMISPVCVGSISGFGLMGYLLALDVCINQLIK
jgi:3-dehydroquinate dehydratase II